MRAEDLAPCVVLQTSPGHLQLWMRVCTTSLEPAVANSNGGQLARCYGGGGPVPIGVIGVAGRLHQPKTAAAQRVR